jgi:hypothetical protein
VASWAVAELVGAELGDTRLNDRLMQIVEAMSEHPEAAIPEACGKAGAKAAYRFFDNPRVQAESILAAHVARTVKRAADSPLVLAPSRYNNLEPEPPSCYARFGTDR